MKTRIALVALALAALAPGMASAQANAPGAPGAPMPPIQQVPAIGQHVRDGWYIGFGLGSGAGSVSANGTSQSFTDMLHTAGAGSPVSVALQFEVGATLRPDLLLGLDIHALRSQGSSPFGDLGVQATEYLAAVTWFPMREGFFLRGGAGVAVLTLDQNDGFGRASDNYGGVALVGGAGYAFWLGRHFNLTLNADLNGQIYGGGSGNPESSRFVDVYLGFSWY
jgi:hypothetical protein